MRAAVSAAVGNRRGCSTEGLDGQRMMTTAGASSASTSSIVIDAVPLSYAVASSVILLMEVRFLS